MPIWIPLAIAATQVASNIIANKHAANVAKRNTNLTIRENKIQAEKAYNIQEQGIKEMNKYNSPSEQMERFRKAGLAPQLIYSQGNAGNQSRIAEYQAAKTDYNYQPGFKADTFAPLSNLSTIAEEIKILVNQGNIGKSEALMKKALEQYADDLAKSEAVIKFNEGWSKKIARVFQEEEFNRFFRYDSNKNLYYLKEGMEETFIGSLAAKWLKPGADLHATQEQAKSQKMDNDIKEAQMVFLKANPGLSQFFKFMEMLQGFGLRKK